MVHFEYLMLVIHVRTYECWVEFLIFFYFWLVQQRPLMDHDDVNKNKKNSIHINNFFFRFGNTHTNFV